MAFIYYLRTALKTKHYTIAIFIPELACPFRCIYCDQQKITGRKDYPAPAEVREIIESHLSSFTKREKRIEIGFFGGNFTGIPGPEQETYLGIAREYLENGQVQGIRLSTRPDYIDRDTIARLKEYGVTTVELGAQSMVDKVLLKSRRGHSIEDTEKASAMIRKAGMRLGLQMMIGLPGDNPEHDRTTAEAFVRLGAQDARIYPTLVIRGTALEQLHHKGEYRVLEMVEAVRRSAEVLRILEGGGVKVIRVGLHPSEGLLSGNDLVAGPFHEAFRELVMTEIWAGEFSDLLQAEPGKQLEIHVAPGQFNFAIGYAAKNKKALLKVYDTVVFYKDDHLKGREFHAHRR